MNTKNAVAKAGLLAILITLAACAATPATTVPASIGVDDILLNPSQFEGKVVNVKGWASIRRESYGIWATQADYEARNWKRCISLLNTYKDDAVNRSLDRTTVLITGTVDPDIYHNKNGEDVIRLGGCNKVGIGFADPDGLKPFPR